MIDAEKMNGIRRLLDAVWDACEKSNVDACFDNESIENNGYDYVHEACLDAALDALGVPQDNSTLACDYANRPGHDWPSWGICRDSLYNEVMTLTEDTSISRDQAIDQYITWVSRLMEQGDWQKADTRFQRMKRLGLL